MVEIRIRELAKINPQIDLKYHYISKDKFSHSDSRNLIVGLATAPFLAFTTQDVLFPENFLDFLCQAIHHMEVFNISGMAIRHESPYAVMNDFFINLTRNLNLNSYLMSDPLGINWWSNNFAIYPREVLLKLPFPAEISWAEDLGWAKLAATKGLALSIFTNTCIYHLNNDSVFGAWQRGKDNARGMLDVHRFLALELPKYSLLNNVFKELLALLKVEIRSSLRNASLVRSFPLVLKFALLWTIQSYSRYFHNRLYYSNFNKRGA